MGAQQIKDAEGYISAQEAKVEADAAGFARKQEAEAAAAAAAFAAGYENKAKVWAQQWEQKAGAEVEGAGEKDARKILMNIVWWPGVLEADIKVSPIAVMIPAAIFLYGWGIPSLDDGVIQLAEEWVLFGALLEVSTFIMESKGGSSAATGSSSSSSPAVHGTGNI